jgi:hypothetical protein
VVVPELVVLAEVAGHDPLVRLAGVPEGRPLVGDALGGKIQIDLGLGRGIRINGSVPASAIS